jgi:hypothetical protein
MYLAVIRYESRSEYASVKGCFENGNEFWAFERCRDNSLARLTKTSSALVP